MTKIEEILQKFQNKIDDAKSNEDLDSLRLEFLGKNGQVTDAMKQIKDIPNDQKKSYGEAVNKLKVTIENGLQNLKDKIQRKMLESKLKNTKRDRKSVV